MNQITSVGVYCASANEVSPLYFDITDRLGQLLGERKLNVVTGGGAKGLMRKISDATVAYGGTSTGVIPQFMIDRGWHNPTLSDMIVVDSMHQRKEQMAAMSDAVIALPGGCGTLEELLEIITWKQLGLYINPVVILNTEGYYNPLLEMFRSAQKEKFMRPQHTGLWAVASTPEEAVELIHTIPQWDKSIDKFVEGNYNIE